jgi:hypothetical protein
MTLEIYDIAWQDFVRSRIISFTFDVDTEHLVHWSSPTLQMQYMLQFYNQISHSTFIPKK